MASFFSLREARLRGMPLPPSIFFHHTRSLDGEYTIKHLHPCLFPMVLGRTYAVEGNPSVHDSFQERLLKHCQALRNQITICEAKVKALHTNALREKQGVNLIKEIDDDSLGDDLESSSRFSLHESSILSSETTNDEDNDYKPLVNLPEIPINVLRSIVAPLIRDRRTFDSLAMTCKELLRACSSINPPPPWPEGLFRLDASVWSVAFSPDGNKLAAGSRDGSIRLFDRRRGLQPPLREHIGRVYSIVFHPVHSHIMVSGSGDGDVRIWNLKNLEEPPTALSTNSPHVDCLAFNHDGSILASSGDGRIRLWDLDTQVCLADINDGSRVVESISFSPDGRTIAGGNWVNRVCLWDLQTYRRVATLIESTTVHSVSFSPDSKYICSASDSNYLRLWNIADQSYTSLEGHRDSIWCVAFSPDGQRIASGSDDGTMRIFETSSGKCKTIFSGHDPDTTVYGVAFSPCCKFVASAGSDGCIELRRYN